MLEGIWLAQSVGHLSLGFSSGHDLLVCGFEPRLGFWADSSEPAWALVFIKSY